MRVNAAPFRVTLQWGKPLTVADGKGTCITSRRGSVWITQDNDLRDVVLTAGGTFRLDHPELAIVQAFDKAEILVEPPIPAARRSLWRTWSQWLGQALAREPRTGPVSAH